MKRGSTVFLQFVVVFVALGALAFLLGGPHLESRNAHATPFDIYFKDPFLAYAYVASVPLFLALYQAFRALAYVRHDAAFSPKTVRALRIIRYCAVAIIGFVVVSVVFLPMSDPADDDGPQGVVLRILVLLPSIVVAVAAMVFERILQNAVDLKSEHDLTV